MIFQGETLPFEPIYGVPMIILWIVTFLFGIILIEAKMMSKKTRIGIYLLILFCGGILLGGIPNAVMPIQQLLISLGSRSDLGYLFPALIILLVLLITSILVGRIFCGYACPLGNLQELISNFNFKSDLKGKKKVKYRIDVSLTLTTKIRWAFLGIIFLLAGVWGIVFLPEVNPLSGFEEFRRFFTFTITIPFIALIIVTISSIFIYRPWCRFLCPFGAISCFLTNFAQTLYIRTDECTQCGLCEQLCPTQEAFPESKKGECYYCNRCVDICPHDAIKLNLN